MENVRDATRRLLVSVLLVSAASCNQTQIQSLPFERALPANGVAREEFAVGKKQLYSVEINYKYSSAPGDRDRVWKLSGGPELGAPFSVDTQITSGSGEKRKIKAVRPTLTSWGAENLSAEVGRVELDPGRYMIELQLIGGRRPPTLAATYSIRRAHTGK